MKLLSLIALQALPVLELASAYNTSLTELDNAKRKLKYFSPNTLNWNNQKETIDNLVDYIKNIEEILISE